MRGRRGARAPACYGREIRGPPPHKLDRLSRNFLKRIFRRHADTHQKSKRHLKPSILSRVNTTQIANHIVDFWRHVIGWLAANSSVDRPRGQQTLGLEWPGSTDWEIMDVGHPVRQNMLVFSSFYENFLVSSQNACGAQTMLFLLEIQQKSELPVPLPVRPALAYPRSSPGAQLLTSLGFTPLFHCDSL